MAPEIPNRDFYQVLPQGNPLNVAADHSAIHSALLQRCPQWHDTKLYKSTNPYPIFTPPSRISELQALSSALQAALPALVRCWWMRPDLQALIPLPPKLGRVLKKLEDARPYNGVVMGAIRPDIIVPPSPKQPLKICEINARFVFNGPYPGIWHSDEVGERFVPDGYEISSSDIRALRESWAQHIDPSEPIGVVIRKERTEGKWIGLPLFMHEHPTSRIVDPATLHVIDGGKLADDKGVIDQFILELHQYEIDNLGEEVLEILGRMCWNDLRTIYLVHDKRMLSILRSEADRLVKNGDITVTQAETLLKGIAETHIIGQPLPVDARHSGKWVLKAATSGKGYGMVIGADLDEHAWRAKVIETVESQRPYILQRFCESKKIELLVHDRSTTPPTARTVRWPIVATAQILHGKFMSLSTWRASNSTIIAISNGGAMIAGVTTAGCWPNGDNYHNKVTRREPTALKVPRGALISAPSSDPSQAQIIATRESLSKYGLAVISLEFPDPDSRYLVSMSKRLGNPLEHSSVADILWDIKPTPGLLSRKPARSETMHQFPWHTDCSFENLCPRYFGLHILHSDRFGGGKLRLLHIDAILARLPPATVSVLKTHSFRFTVPFEFQKNEGEIVEGPVMTSQGKAKLRYRRDLMQGLTKEAEEALKELDAAIERAEGEVKMVGPDVMRDGTVIFVDNGRWLHARSEVKDPNRWLRRVRGGPEEFV